MHTGYRSYGARNATEYAPWANANIIVCVLIESLEGRPAQGAGTSGLWGATSGP